MTTSTSTDPRRFEWPVRDQVVRLRRWGTDDFYELPTLEGAAPRELRIGSSGRCAIQLDDPMISRQHALLSYANQRWGLLDLQSKNGLRIDGVQHYTARLEPGMEIGLGKVVLLAESPRSIGLRCFLGRMLGWSAERREAVDLALRELRLSKIHPSPLVLRGEGDLISLARDLHDYLFDAAAPFIVCDPERVTGGALARVPANFQRGPEALAAARGGTLCVRSDKLPDDFPALLAEAHPTEGPSSALVMICDEGLRPLRVERERTIQIPALASRSEEERAHVVTEYAADAALALGVRRTLSEEEQRWVLQHAGASLGEIGKGARRLLALRVEGTIAGAARRLGMRAPSLRQWFAARPLPAGRRQSDEAAMGADPEERDP